MLDRRSPVGVVRLQGQPLWSPVAASFEIRQYLVQQLRHVDPELLAHAVLLAGQRPDRLDGAGRPSVEVIERVEREHRREQIVAVQIAPGHQQIDRGGGIVIGAEPSQRLGGHDLYAR